MYFNTDTNIDLIQVFYIGFKFDLRLATLLVLPLLLLGWIKWLHPTNHKIGRIFWQIYLILIFSSIVFLYFLDFGHYSYLKVHLNKTVLRFLDNATISTIMLWQSYPIIWIIVFFIGLIVSFKLLLKKIIVFIGLQKEYNLSKVKKVFTNIAIGFVVLLFLYGKISSYPLRWVDAHFNGHHFSADLVTNPILYYFDTLRYSDNTYEKEDIIEYYPRVSQYLKLGNNKVLDYSRPLELTPKVTGNPNLVLVFLESFASYKTGLFGNPLNSSPNFDKLAKNSLFFNRFYVAHTGTARSVFTNITGIPDTNDVKTSSRNPLVVSQNTLINAFKGYSKHYFLGGSASWGNIRGVLKENIKGLKIYEEGYYKSPVQDVWGVSDADLFLEAGDVLKKQTKPFVAIIQTSGNHHPYTIPKPSYGFKLSQESYERAKKYGFSDSSKELNSFRFMDHSIGLFIQHAKDNNYYDNTVFVFFADHGIRADGGLHRPKTENELQLGTYHIPMVIHAPKFIKPQVIDTVAGQPDMLAIVAGIMNKPYVNTALGRNMLAKKYQDEQYAFTIERGYRMAKIGLVGKEFVFKMYVNGDKPQLYKLSNTEKAINVLEDYPEKGLEMKKLAEGIYETSKYLLEHNQKVKVE